MTQTPLIVGLHDNTFRGSESSTAYATPAHLTYARDVTDHDGPVLFVDGYTAWPTADTVTAPVKIGWLHEPPELIPALYEDALRNVSRFNGGILTYDAELLKLPGFRFTPYAGCWIERKYWGLHSKVWVLCSQLCGDKISTSGHQMRHAVQARLAGLHVMQYGKYGHPVDYSQHTKMLVNLPYAFTIVTETCRVDNLFTEWLLDCFAVGTIPIFWGCPNVGDYFDARGILSFETADECAAIVEGLSFDLYDSLLPYAAGNMLLAGQYACAEDWMYEHILREYDK